MALRFDAVVVADIIKVDCGGRQVVAAGGAGREGTETLSFQTKNQRHCCLSLKTEGVITRTCASACTCLLIWREGETSRQGHGARSAQLETTDCVVRAQAGMYSPTSVTAPTMLQLQITFVQACVRLEESLEAVNIDQAVVVAVKVPHDAGDFVDGETGVEAIEPLLELLHRNSSLIRLEKVEELLGQRLGRDAPGVLRRRLYEMPSHELCSRDRPVAVGVDEAVHALKLGVVQMETQRAEEA
eukprot:scaffold7339_cov249-Pinguiococcus_pyrenoidosus.AAC.11